VHATTRNASPAAVRPRAVRRCVSTRAVTEVGRPARSAGSVFPRSRRAETVLSLSTAWILLLGEGDGTNQPDERRQHA
jgi:hypothetical protein